MRDDLTQQELKQQVHYHQSSGLFTRLYVSCGKVKVGDIAGNINAQGYVDIRVNSITYKAHRLVWLYMEGYFPENDIDHINRMKWDNRWKNLRHVSKSCNAKNKVARSDNISGINGVGWGATRNHWVVRIQIPNKRKHIGYFKNLDDAIMARWKAEVKYDFPNCNSTSTAYVYLKENNLI